MKKMIIAAAIVCAATFANAASCEWTLTGVQASETTALSAGAMTAYFMDGDTFKTFSELSSDKLGAYVSGNALSTANLVVARNQGSAGASFGDFTPGDSVSGYIVIFDNADVGAATYYANTVVSTLDVPSAGNVKFSRAFGTTTAGWQKIEAVTPPPVTPDVPEPTSGLLLVLGGAALALRRRR